MTKDHDNKVCQTKYEQLPSRWNNSSPHIPLAHETHEVHKGKSTKKVMKGIPSIFDLKCFVSFRVFRGPKTTLKRSNVATIDANLLIMVAGLSAGSAT